MNTPKFSIVIPAFSAERYHGGTSCSVIAQTRGDWEMVIVDDGSISEKGMTRSQIAAVL